MHNAVNNLRVKPSHLLIDGCDFTPYIYINDGDEIDVTSIAHTCIEKGDNKFTSIAAASILAKVARDKYIIDLCDKYPNLDEFYGLRSNKGYGSKKHLHMELQNGIVKHLVFVKIMLKIIN